MGTRDDPATELSLDEVVERFDGQWVLIRVTRLDTRDVPTHGRVVMHGLSHEKVCARRDELVSQSGSRAPYYVFHAKPFLTTGAELRVALQHLEELAVEDVEARC